VRGVGLLDLVRRLVGWLVGWGDSSFETGIHGMLGIVRQP